MGTWINIWNIWWTILMSKPLKEFRLISLDRPRNDDSRRWLLFFVFHLWRRSVFTIDDNFSTILKIECVSINIVIIVVVTAMVVNKRSKSPPWSPSGSLSHQQPTWPAPQNISWMPKMTNGNFCWVSSRPNEITRPVWKFPITPEELEVPRRAVDQPRDEEVQARLTWTLLWLVQLGIWGG